MLRPCCSCSTGSGRRWQSKALQKALFHLGFRTVHQEPIVKDLSHHTGAAQQKAHPGVGIHDHNARV